MPRMQILTTQEQDNFNKPPLLDHAQRKQFFDFPQKIMDVAHRLRNPTNQIGFLLLCGYFKAAKRFFLPRDFYERDITAVENILSCCTSVFVASDYKKVSRLRHQQSILEYYGFQGFSESSKFMIKNEIDVMSSYYLKPRLIFDRCCDILIQKRVALPEAWEICELIRQSLQLHKQALILRMNNHLTPEISTLLDSLFAREGQSYRLTLLKRLSQSTKPAQVREGIKDFRIIAELHRQISNILDVLKLGPAGIRYYAGSVMRSQIFQMQQRSLTDRYIHASAFVAHQYYCLQDNLVDIFLNVMAAFQTTIANERQEKALDHQKAQQNQLEALIQNLEIGFSVIREIRSIANDNTLLDGEKVYLIKKALNYDSPSNIENIREEFLALSDDATLHDLQEGKSLRLQNRLSPVLKVVHFHSEPQRSHLTEAIEHFRKKDGHVTEQVPVAFLNEVERKALYRKDKTFRPSLYKIFLFQHVASAIRSGKLNLEHSYKYRPLDEYMVSQERWAKEKHQLLERAGLLDLMDSQMTLHQLDQVLYEQYRATNARIPQNEYLSFKTNGEFCAKTPMADHEDTDPLQAWFPKRHYISLVEVLETAHQHSDMLSAFEHWQQTYTQSTASHPALLAGIIGLGCKIGVRKMARISSHVSENELDHTVNWRFSLENIREANDRVLAVMDKMELPNIYRNKEDKLHTASDGQKFEVRAESLMASRSFKYFGQGQGVSAYTFIDERHFLWHSTVISASERESAYVIDGLMNNDVVKSDIHSTDTHGYSEAIFGLTHMLGFSFAPRLKGLKNQQLYIFKHRRKEERKTWKFKPDHYVNAKLLHQNWDDLLRLVTTIKLKENTASDIFRRLNSYSKQHALYQTIKAFGQIIKSLFILRYLDDVGLRQAIEKQLNKVELAHRFTRVVAIGNPREFTQTEKEEQEIAEACNRLIKNCIICWNYLYLAHKLKQITNDNEKEHLLNIISSHSIMTWSHINMFGEYDFSEEKRKDSIGILPPKNVV